MSAKPQASAEDDEDFGGDLLAEKDSGFRIQDSGKAVVSRSPDRDTFADRRSPRRE
ncbi:MAG: hypothetical protein H7039_02285 [Bryobacteraceae bacterium]|nr:hypothetical protein [Bryobacteraceae bacterium]